MGLLSWLRGGQATKSARPTRAQFSRGFGRTHLAEHPYTLPKDLEESGRLDFQHFLLRSAFKGNYIAPINAPRDILDVGCGTGRWAMEMAQTFPDANVIGIDIVPPEQDKAQVFGYGLENKPDNYAFVQGDILQGLPFPDRSFDFTHMRLLFSAIPSDRWPRAVGELTRVLRAGGWVQLLEAYPVPNGGPILKRWQHWSEQLGKQRGIDFLIAQHLGELLQQAGLRDVHQQRADLPVGKWGGRLGVMLEKDLTAVIRGMKFPIVKMGTASAEEYDSVCEAMIPEFAREQEIFPFYVAYGRKP
jgi:ubiquinone/menaquinone biosynthesis C-methylase UbiE